VSLFEILDLYRDLETRARGHSRYPKSKIANFSHPVYFVPQLNGVPLRIGYRRKVENVLR